MHSWDSTEPSSNTEAFRKFAYARDGIEYENWLRQGGEDCEESVQGRDDVERSGFGVRLGQR